MSVPVTSITLNRTLALRTQQLCDTRGCHGNAYCGHVCVGEACTASTVGAAIQQSLHLKRCVATYCSITFLCGTGRTIFSALFLPQTPFSINERLKCDESEYIAGPL